MIRILFLAFFSYSANRPIPKPIAQVECLYPITLVCQTKEKVLTLLDDQDAKVYRFSDFSNENIIKDSFKGKDYLLVGNSDFMFVYELNKALNDLGFYVCF